MASILNISSGKSFTKKDRPENIEGEFVIPQEFTEIGERAFSGCSSLTSIVIPDSVTKIGEHAFSGCSSLTSIVIPDSVTKIGKYAFNGCKSLTSIVIPKSVTMIDSFTFSDCKSLTSIVIPESVTEIEFGAFSDCSSLTSIVIPDSVTKIGESAFNRCSSLTDIKVSDSNSNYSSLDGVLYDKNRTTLLSCYKTVTNIVIPNSVTSIGKNAFVGCTRLTSIKIPSSVTSIGAYAFDGCTSLTSIEIPNSVTSIEGAAFQGCISLTSIEIPNSVTSIGGAAFQGCTSLTSIEIPNSVTSIGTSAFCGTSLTSIVIPEGVTMIDSFTFSDCKSLTSIVIPDSVTKIGESAFAFCFSLSLFEYPKKLKFKKKDVFFRVDIEGIKFVEREAKPASKATATAASANVDIVSDALKGQVICVSGKFKDHSQEEMEALVSSNGATVSSSVTKKTTMLVTGDKVGATKLTKAQELGIKIVPQDEFFNILNGGTNEASAAKGRRTVHIKTYVDSYTQWSACYLSREELMEFISEHSGEDVDLDDDEEGFERACEIIGEHGYDLVCELGDDRLDFWNLDANLTLTVEDGDDTLEFGADELRAVPVSEVQNDKKSDEEFVFFAEMINSDATFETNEDIEIEGEFDLSKLSVIKSLEVWSDGAHCSTDVLYDGVDTCLWTTRARGVSASYYLKKNKK